MAYSTVAARLPDEDKKALDFVMRYEKTDRSTTARKIIELGIAQWKKHEALHLLREGKLTFSAAARFADLSIWEMLELVKREKPSFIDVTRQDIEEDLGILK